MSSPISSSRSEQGVPQGLDHVPVLLEHPGHRRLGAARSASTSARPPSLDSTLDTMPPAGYSMAADEISGGAHAQLPDHLAGVEGGGLEVAGHAGGGLAEEELLGHHATEGDVDERPHLRLGLGEALLLLGVAEQARGRPSA